MHIRLRLLRENSFWLTDVPWVTANIFYLIFQQKLCRQAAFAWVYIFLQRLCLHRSEKQCLLLRYPSHVVIFTSYSSSDFEPIASLPSALLLRWIWLTNTERRSAYISISKVYLLRADSTHWQATTECCYLSDDSQISEWCASVRVLLPLFCKMRQHFRFVFAKTIPQRGTSSWPSRINEKT